MKHYQQQESGELKRTYMQQTGHICECCEDYLHTHEEEGGHEPIDGDVECPKCGQLCGCKCHRRESPQ